ncbi:MAG: hypothetical protein K2Z81_03990, partial [Cyanobacteria bacterium]|nr:hypothetical protein [Cyanobacteriota bacterium]
NRERAIPANPTRYQVPENAAAPFTPGNFAPNGAPRVPTGFVYQHMVPNTVNADLSAILQAMGMRGTTSQTLRDPASTRIPRS